MNAPKKKPKKELKRCARCGKLRRDHIGMENFCPDYLGKTFVYPKGAKR